MLNVYTSARFTALQNRSCSCFFGRSGDVSVRVSALLLIAWQRARSCSGPASAQRSSRPSAPCSVRGGCSGSPRKERRRARAEPAFGAVVAGAELVGSEEVVHLHGPPEDPLHAPRVLCGISVHLGCIRVHLVVFLAASPPTVFYSSPSVGILRGHVLSCIRVY